MADKPRIKLLRELVAEYLSELKTLEDNAAAIDRKKKTVRQGLEEARSLLRREEQKEPISQVDSEPDETSSAPLGFRGLIMEILEDASSDLSTNDIAKAMTDRGWRDKASTPLETRVNNELGRLVKNRVIKRVRRGIYRLPNNNGHRKGEADDVAASSASGSHA